MGSGHGHLEVAGPPLRLKQWPRVVVLGLIVASALVALLGVVHWWPNEHRDHQVGGSIPFAAKGYKLVHAQLVSNPPVCTTAAKKQAAACGDTRVRLLDGRNAGRTVELGLTPDVVGTGLRSGDKILLFDSSAIPGVQEPGVLSSDFSYYRADRGPSMIWLAALFALAVVVVARKRGFMALVSLGFAGLIVVGFLIPALLSGQPAIPVTLVSSTLILIVMLYLTHGFSMRTSVALVGALIGIALSSAFAWAGIIGARLSGLGDESASLLTFNVPWIDVQQLVVASVILASLGTLNDVTITQVSALWELRGASSTTRHWDLFRRAMRIGRDHVASTVYTLVFAYLGVALVLLVARQLYGGDAYDFITSDSVAEEVIRALVGGIALVLTMPLTTAIGTLIIANTTSDTIAARPGRRHTHPVASRSRRSAPVASHFERFPDDPWKDD